MSSLKALERTVIFYSSSGQDTWDAGDPIELAEVSGILSLGTGSVEPQWSSEIMRQTARFHFAPFSGMENLSIGDIFIYAGVSYEISGIDLTGRLPGAPYTCRVEGAKQ